MSSNSTSMPITSQTSSEGDGPGSSSYDCYVNRSTEYQLAADFIEKVQALRYLLETDLLACDAKWTLFVAAALSYRYDSQLKPFPPRFVNEQTGLNIDALVSVINDTPKLRVVLQNIIEENYEEFDAEVMDLLHHVLVVLREPALQLVDDDEFDLLLRSMGQSDDLPRPTHIFRVCSTPTLSEIAPEESAEQPPEEYQPKLAFHGNKLDSFFALLARGTTRKHLLQYVENASDAVEPPLLLNTDLGISLQHSPDGAGWGASCCGSMISCVALCEFDNNPDYVVCDNDSTGIVVRKSELVHVRYLLFYGSRFPDDDDPEERKVSSWLGRHKYSLSLACYMLLLASIGVANSGSGQYWKQVLSKKAHVFFDFCRRIFTTD